MDRRRQGAFGAETPALPVLVVVLGLAEYQLLSANYFFFISGKVFFPALLHLPLVPARIVRGEESRCCRNRS